MSSMLHPNMELLIHGFCNFFDSIILPMDIIYLIVRFTITHTFDPAESLVVIVINKTHHKNKEHTLSINLATESASAISSTKWSYGNIQCTIHDATLPNSTDQTKYSMFVHVDNSVSFKYMFHLTTYNPYDQSLVFKHHQLPALYRNSYVSYRMPGEMPNVVYNPAESSIYSLYDRRIDVLKLDGNINFATWESLKIKNDFSPAITHGITCMIQDKFIAIINGHNIRLFALNCNMFHSIHEIGSYRADYGKAIYNEKYHQIIAVDSNPDMDKYDMNADKWIHLWRPADSRKRTNVISRRHDLAQTLWIAPDNPSIIYYSDVDSNHRSVIKKFDLRICEWVGDEAQIVLPESLSMNIHKDGRIGNVRSSDYYLDAICYIPGSR